jgi:hypothetical protein
VDGPATRSEGGVGEAVQRWEATRNEDEQKDEEKTLRNDRLEEKRYELNKANRFISWSSPMNGESLDTSLSRSRRAWQLVASATGAQH